MDLQPQFSHLLFFLLPGLSSWGRRVGRRLRPADSDDRLEYAVNPAAGDSASSGSLRLNSSKSGHDELKDGDEKVHESPVEILRSVPDLRRKVSRVESLRRLILGASHLDSHRLFDKKKYRIRRSSATAGKVDKAIGTDLDLMVGGGFSEDDLFDRTSSRFNASCESFDLDSVSQLSLADTGGGEGQRAGTSGGGGSNAPLKSISIDNIPSEVTAYHRTAMSHAFLRSRLASLPEENPGLGATLGRRPKEERRPRSGSLVVALPPAEDEEEEESDQLLLSLTGPQSLGSDILRPLAGGIGALSRKRSQSMADIIQRVAHSGAEVAPDSRHNHLHHPALHEPPLTGVISRHKIFTKTRSEESGYDSDTTRKSGSSPRGSVKSDSFDPSETDSSTCDSHIKPDLLDAPACAPDPMAGLFDASPALAGPATAAPEVVKPRMKKPPRKSKEELRRVEISCQTDHSVIADGADLVQPPPPKLPPVSPPSAAAETTDEPDILPPVRPSSTLPLNFADNIPTTLPSLTSKSFKMVRLYKSPTDELGIIISKKRNPSKGTTGYIIAHIEPDGLVNRYRHISLAVEGFTYNLSPG